MISNIKQYIVEGATIIWKYKKMCYCNKKQKPIVEQKYYQNIKQSMFEFKTIIIWKYKKGIIEFTTKLHKKIKTN